MSRRCLWRPLDQTLNGKRCRIPAQTREKEREFYEVRCTSLEEILQSDGSYTHLTIIEPPQRSLVDIINCSLVVGQEVALAIFLLAVHRVIVHEESTRQEKNSIRKASLDGDHTVRESSIAMVLVYATLLIIVYYNQKALNNQSTVTGQRRKKAMVRMTDAILLAAILRLTSGIIHTLTATYSSDTVYLLSISGMGFHLLTCDYKYANGVSHGGDLNISSLHTFAHPRPAFLGGTVSLNAVFFSTALLVSRIESNASSYAFFSLAVTLFAFYPATRHNIAIIYPNSLWGSPCALITITLSISVWLITSPMERVVFLGTEWVVLILSPLVQWNLQKHQRFISGSWDIAHISPVEIHKTTGL